jgi:phosphoadenosine phosphosulfate reductase
MVGQSNLFGESKIQLAIERLKCFCPEEGYYLAFSGGKDSQCIHQLAIEAEVKFDAHYSVTGIDPPELVYSIKKNYPNVIFDYPKKTMWKLIEEKRMPPTKIVRYCCSELKENGGDGRICVTGVRWAESTRRKNGRSIVEYGVYGSKSKKAQKEQEIFKMSDNDKKKVNDGKLYQQRKTRIKSDCGLGR